MLGKIAVMLPDCYTLRSADKMVPSHKYLVKGDSIKLDLLTDGWKSLDRSKERSHDKSFTCSDDTIKGRYYRLICYRWDPDPDASSFSVDIVDTKDYNELFKDKYPLLLYACKAANARINKEEQYLFINAFKTALLKNDSLSHSK